MSLGKAEYILFEMTLPNLKETEWEECFHRRFLPGWAKWKTSTWKAAFLKYALLHFVYSWLWEVFTCTQNPPPYMA